jgi:hypothetical protein
MKALLRHFEPSSNINYISIFVSAQLHLHDYIKFHNGQNPLWLDQRSDLIIILTNELKKCLITDVYIEGQPTSPLISTSKDLS